MWVNIKKLLIKRLQILGVPDYVISLIEAWLSDWACYHTVNGVSSRVIDLSHGTIQDFILGPILYTIYVSPLFDLTDLTNFADENSIFEWKNTIPELIDIIQLKLEIISKWLKDSRLIINENKMELCLFHRKDQSPINITVN